MKTRGKNLKPLLLLDLQISDVALRTFCVLFRPQVTVFRCRFFNPLSHVFFLGFLHQHSKGAPCSALCPADRVGLKIHQITSVLCSKHSVASQVIESKLSVANFKILKPKTGPPLQSSPLLLILFPQHAKRGPNSSPWTVRPSPSFLYFSP